MVILGTATVCTFDHMLKTKKQKPHILHLGKANMPTLFLVVAKVL